MAIGILSLAIGAVLSVVTLLCAPQEAPHKTISINTSRQFTSDVFSLKEI